MMAVNKLRKSKPITPTEPNMAPIAPPTTAPATPNRMVSTTPNRSGPGMIHLATDPATSPNTIHNKIPISGSQKTFEENGKVQNERHVNRTGDAASPAPSRGYLSRRLRTFVPRSPDDAPEYRHPLRNPMSRCRRSHSAQLP